MTRELIEQTLGKGQKGRIVVDRPSIITITPISERTKTVGAARLHRKLSSSEIDPEIEERLDNAFRQYVQDYRQYVASMIGSSERISAELEFDLAAERLRLVTEDFIDAGWDIELFGQRFDELIKEVTIGETHMGEPARINQNAVSCAKELILDVFTTPTQQKIS